MNDSSHHTDGSDGSRRGIFRRGRRDEAAPAGQGGTTTVEYLDELARRVDALADAGSSPELDRDVVAQGRAAIASANDSAATSGGPGRVNATRAVPAPANPEAPVSQTTDASTEDAQLQARMAAALAPTPQPAVVPTTQPGAQPAAPRQAVELQQAPTRGAQPASTPAVDAPTAASLGIDVARMVRLVEDEAVAIRQRIDLEMRQAQAEATDLVARAEGEAERIREHGQAQARVLLGEVEEIISEAQQTGEQILQRADEEAAHLRGEATAVLQQAKSESRSIIDTARREGEQVLAEQRRLATVRAQEAMREQDRLKDQIRRLEERRRQVLESLEPLISQLTQMMPSQAGNVVPLDRNRGE